MGAEAAYIPLILTAVGAAAQAGNQYYTNKRQEEVQLKNSRTQQRKQHEADARVNEEIGKMGASNSEDERSQALRGFIDQLKKNSSQTAGPVTPGGERFKSDSTVAKAAVQNYGADRADTVSRIAAPGYQRMNERISMARAGDDLSGISREAQGWDTVSRIKASQIHANPWIDALGKTMMAAGMSGVGGGVGGGGELSPVNITASRMPVGEAFRVPMFP